MTSETVDPTYDSAGNLRSGSHLDLMTRFEFDAVNQMTAQVIDPSLDALGLPRAGTHLDVTHSLTYDGNGRLTSLTDPKGNVTTWVYDGLGFLQTKIEPTGALGLGSRPLWGPCTGDTTR